ncbi:MAG: hypothetical protein V3S89_10140 [Desulfobacterales bacterium]
MANNKKESESFPGIRLPGTSASDLRGKQSVRTTFKLSARTISAVSIVATHLGIKQKSLFDHLIEDIQSLSSIADKIRHAETRGQRNADRGAGRGVQKTYVISRKSLRSLDQISKDYDTPRDMLVEYSVQRLLPIIKREREKHKNRKEIFSALEQYLTMGRQIRDEAVNRLGEDDPVSLKLKAALATTENAYKDIAQFIERGSIIEDF